MYIYIYIYTYIYIYISIYVYTLRRGLLQEELALRRANVGGLEHPRLRRGHLRPDNTYVAVLFILYCNMYICIYVYTHYVSVYIYIYIYILILIPITFMLYFNKCILDLVVVTSGPADDTMRYDTMRYYTILYCTITH